jgi:hypothetical protein
MPLEKKGHGMNVNCSSEVIWTAAASVFAAYPKNWASTAAQRSGDSQSFNEFGSFTTPKPKVLRSDTPTPMQRSYDLTKAAVLRRALSGG